MHDKFTHLPAVIFELAVNPDGDSHFSYISAFAAEMLGIDHQQFKLPNIELTSVIKPVDVQAFNQHLSECIEKKSSWNWTGRILLGQNRPLIQIQSEFDGRNGGIIYHGFIRDISNAVDQETEIRYQSLVEKLPIGIAIHHQQKILYANEQAHIILSAQKGQLLGKNVLNIIHPDFHDQVRDRIYKVLAGQNVPLLEQKYLRMDGNAVDVEAMAYPFTYNGEPCVQIIFRDLSERKQAETRIKRNEMLFTQLFQNAPMAVVMLDEMGKVHLVNRGFEQMFGFERNELRGHNLNDFIVPEELRNEGIDLNNLITSNQVVSIETIRRHRSGRLVNVILCGVPVMLENQTIGIYGVYIDITDRKEVEEELKIRNAELDNFVYKVSHDLRAPLSSILGLVNLARLPGNTDNPMDYINIIGEKVTALDHFIGDVLSHSKNLKMEVNIRKVDLNKIIDQTFTELGYLEGAQEIKRSIKIEGIDFYSDHWRISEIFRNLISNAIKYRQINGHQAEINIRVHIDNLRTDINFSDNGIGIDENSLSKIFEMFYRATEQSDGSGIGLYIVKNAVEKLGGQITVASKINHGTKFNIILPNRINNILNKASSFVEAQQR